MSVGDDMTKQMSCLVDQLEQLIPRLGDVASELVASFCDELTANGALAVKRALSLASVLRRVQQRSEHIFEGALASFAAGYGGNLILVMPTKVGGNTEIHHNHGTLQLLIPV